VPAEGDAIIFQRILDGALEAMDGLVQIAQSDGLPIATSQGFLFAVPDAGNGPYQLTSPNGRFAPVTMKMEAGVAWAIVPIADPDGAEYACATAFGDPFYDPLNRHVRYAGTRHVSLVRSSAPHMERWPGVGDATIPARTLRVWVQPGQVPTHFMYAHDGQNLFDPGANYGGWRLQDAAGPSTLVVGIDNSPDRVAEYTPVVDLLTLGGSGLAYADFVEETVRPFVESRYGIPLRRAVMGSSLGGVIAYAQELRHPGVYDLVASLSGTMGWGSISMHEPTIIEQYAALAQCPDTAFYLDSGGGPGSGCVDSDLDGIVDDAADAEDNYCENVQLREVLETLGCAEVTYAWAAGREHSEAAWRDRAPAIFDLFEAM
jgi:hypothetical protein